MRTDPDSQLGARALAQVLSDLTYFYLSQRRALRRFCYRRTATCVCNVVEYGGGPVKARRKHGEMQPVHFLED